MALILAIESDRRQAAQLSNIVRQHVGAELLLADTTEGALESIGNRVPDLVLVPALLSPQDDAALATALKVIATAAHVQMLTIPVLAKRKGGGKPAKRGVLSSLLGGDDDNTPGEGCDPTVFAEQIVSYLAAAAEQREAEERAKALARQDAELVIDSPRAPAPAPTLEAEWLIEPEAPGAGDSKRSAVYQPPAYDQPPSDEQPVVINHVVNQTVIVNQQPSVTVVNEQKPSPVYEPPAYNIAPVEETPAVPIYEPPTAFEPPEPIAFETPAPLAEEPAAPIAFEHPVAHEPPPSIGYQPHARIGYEPPAAEHEPLAAADSSAPLAFEPPAPVAYEAPPAIVDTPKPHNVVSGTSAFEHQLAALEQTMPGDIQHVQDLDWDTEPGIAEPIRIDPDDIDLTTALEGTLGAEPRTSEPAVEARASTDAAWIDEPFEPLAAQPFASREIPTIDPEPFSDTVLEFTRAIDELPASSAPRAQKPATPAPPHHELNEWQRAWPEFDLDTASTAEAQTVMNSAEAAEEASAASAPAHVPEPARVPEIEATASEPIVAAGMPATMPPAAPEPVHAAPPATAETHVDPIAETAEPVPAASSPAASTPARGAPAAPAEREWVELIASLRRDVQRLRTERTQAKPSARASRWERLTKAARPDKGARQEAKPAREETATAARTEITTPEPIVSAPAPPPAPAHVPAPAAAAPLPPPSAAPPLPAPAAVAQPPAAAAPEPPAAATPAEKPKAKRPLQDEWGLFDPEQCGFAALLAKLDEISDDEPSTTARRSA